MTDQPDDLATPEREEAYQLARDFDPHAIAAKARDEGTDPLGAVVGQAMGLASVCWENMSGTGTFESTRAAHASRKVVDWIHSHDSEARLPRLEPGDRLLVAFNHDVATNDAITARDALRDFLDTGDRNVAVISGAQMLVVASDYVRPNHLQGATMSDEKLPDPAAPKPESPERKREELPDRKQLPTEPLEHKDGR